MSISVAHMRAEIFFISLTPYMNIEEYPVNTPLYFTIQYQIRFHFAPWGMSVTSMPAALSSSRMRSASA